jgi:hypothetical protein
VIPEAELKKHKIQDIFGFIKSGNLAMVNGLIHHHKLGQSVFALLGSTEEFHFTKADKVKMADWNPLLVAIAFKKIEIVKYFLHDMHASLKVFGSKPGQTEHTHLESELAARQSFCLTLAAANKDVVMFNELWSSIHT